MQTSSPIHALFQTVAFAIKSASATDRARGRRAISRRQIGYAALQDVLVAASTQRAPHAQCFGDLGVGLPPLAI